MKNNLIIFFLICSLSAFAQPSVVDTTRFEARNGNAYFVATALALKNYIGGGGDVTNGGNSFGAAMTIGTNDNYNLSLETNGTTRATFSNAGAITLNSLGGGVEINTDAGEITLHRKRYATSSTADFAISAESDGTPVAGFGPSLILRSQSSTTLNRDIGRISSIWTTATDASRTSDMVFSTVNSATTNEAFRLYGNQRAMVGGGSNEASAALQVNSTSGGFLPPKMTDAQMAAIASPTEGLIVENTTVDGLCWYNGAAWDRLTCNVSPSISLGTGSGTGATGSITGSDIAGVIAITAGTSPATNATAATITFNTAFKAAPKAVMITAADSDAPVLLYNAGAGRFWFIDSSDITTSSFLIKTGAAGNTAVNGTEYKFFYHVIQ